MLLVTWVLSLQMIALTETSTDVAAMSHYPITFPEFIFSGRKQNLQRERERENFLSTQMIIKNLKNLMLFSEDN